MLDLRIRNANIVDGKNEEYIGNIAVKNGKIVADNGDEAESEIDATGKFATPGFIDFHSHADLELFCDPSMKILSKQGVTSCFAGLCGLSLAPFTDKYRKIIYDSNIGIKGKAQLQKRLNQVYCFSDLLKVYRETKIGVNMALMTGLANIRASVLGFSDKKSSQNEIIQQKELLEQSILQGSFGLSAGFIYPPDTYCTDEELFELLKVVAKHDALFNVHMRSESSEVVENVQNYINLCEKAGARLHISHHKTAGVKNHGKSKQTLEIIHEAKLRGVNVTIDAYPYTASASGLKNIIPPKYFLSGVKEFAKALKNIEVRKAIRQDILSGNSFTQLNEVGFDKIMIMISNDKTALGKTVQEIAQARDRDCFEVAFDLLQIDEGMTMAGYFTMNEEDVERIMKYEDCCFGTDGAIFPEGVSEHPRCSSMYHKLFGEYVRDKKLLTLNEAVYKASILPSKILNLNGKGSLALGKDADITVFDLDKMKQNATYLDMNIKNDGVLYTIIGGRIALENENSTDCLCGKIILRGE